MWAHAALGWPPGRMNPWSGGSPFSMRSIAASTARARKPVATPGGDGGTSWFGKVGTKAEREEEIRQIGTHKHRVDLQQFRKDLGRKKKIAKLMHPELVRKDKSERAQDEVRTESRHGKFSWTVRDFREATVDAEKRTARVVLINEGLGNLRDKNYYTQEALESAAPIFDGTQCFLDHPSKSEEQDRPERSVRDLCGYFFEPEVKAAKDGKVAVFANLRFREGQAGDEAIALVKDAIDYQTRFPAKEQTFCGLSINADGDSHPDTIDGEDVNMVDKFTSAFSIDVVTKPARGGKFIALQEAEGGDARMGFTESMAAWRRTRREAQYIRELEGKVRKAVRQHYGVDNGRGMMTSGGEQRQPDVNVRDVALDHVIVGVKPPERGYDEPEDLFMHPMRIGRKDGSVAISDGVPVEQRYVPKKAKKPVAPAPFAAAEAALQDPAALAAFVGRKKVCFHCLELVR